MKNLTKAVALSAILGGAILATTPAQAWWGWPGGGNNWNDNWMDGFGWGDMNFSTSMGGRGYGRGYGRDYYGYGPYGYGYPYGGGMGYPYGGGWGAPGYGRAPCGQPAPQDRPSSETDK
ncbi:MAG: sulfur globule family protein [Pseudomonadota bacterium]